MLRLLLLVFLLLSEDPRGTGLHPQLPLDSEPEAAAAPAPESAPPPAPEPAPEAAPSPEPEQPQARQEKAVERDECMAIRELVARSGLKASEVGISSMDFPSGKVRCELNPEKEMNPASATKILTAAAALQALGKDRHFSTEVFAGDKSVCLKGGGDPELDLAGLEALAKSVAEMKLEPEKVVIDLSLFDDQDLPPCFEQKKNDAWYRTETGALAYKDGTVLITVKAGARKNGPPLVETDPDSEFFVIDNQGGPKGKLTTSVKKGKSGAVVSVSGGFTRRGAAVYARRMVPNPSGLSASIFLEKLHALGLARNVLAVEYGSCAGGLTKLHAVRSRTIGELVARMLLESNNFIAEMLLKHLDRDCTPRSFSCGLAVLAATAADLGVPPERLRLKNGSGLYDANRFSPRDLMKIMLEASTRKGIEKDFNAGLPVAGKSGTMRSRLGALAGRVRGKTGTLDGVSSLVGYIEKKHGRVYFAIIINSPGVVAGQLRRLQDRIVELLDDPSKAKPILSKSAKPAKAKPKHRKKGK